MRKKLLSLVLALVMCLGLTVPAFAAESNEWKMEVLGKSDAEASADGKTFTLRDCGFFDYDSTGEMVLYKDDDLQWTAENLRVLAKGDTAVLTYKPEEFTSGSGVSGGGWSTQVFTLIAWSDPDGDGVYDKRMIGYDEDEGSFSDEENGYYELLLENREVLPAGIDVSNGSEGLGLYDTAWGCLVNAHEDGDEVRLSADRVLELFGPNTLVWIICGGVIWDSSSPDWSILVEGDASQPAVPAASAAGNFTDVKTGDYFADPVLWAVEKKITAGTSTTTFSPDDTCTQGQILTFLWRAKGEPAPSGTVSGSEFYAKAAQWAEEQGLTDNFSAEADCTRAMVVTYLWKLAGSPKAGTPDFSDVSANADYAQAVAWAVEQGITSGTGDGTTFSPDETCTRGQIATFLYRAFAE